MTTPKKSIFTNREKEAQFWENNYKQTWETGKPIKINVSKNLSETINVRFDSTTISSIRKLAKKKGLRPTQLIRMWTKEGLDQTVSH